MLDWFVRYAVKNHYWDYVHPITSRKNTNKVGQVVQNHKRDNDHSKFDVFINNVTVTNNHDQGEDDDPPNLVDAIVIRKIEINDSNFQFSFIFVNSQVS